MGIENDSLTGYKKRKLDRINHYKENVEYWVYETCAACNGTGYYDSDDNPYCGSCDGKGNEWVKPLYELGITDINKMIGKTLSLKINIYTEIKVYINKRREVIYQYVSIDGKLSSKRIRRRLTFGYTDCFKHLDWSFSDLEGNTYSIHSFTETNTI